MRRTMLILLGMLSIASVAAEEPPKTGAFQIRFQQRSPLSTALQIAERLGGTAEDVRKAVGEKEYGLAAESFEVRVPESYTDKERYGLIVWVSPGATAGTPREWTQVLDKHKLIWIGANNSGNDRGLLVRIGLALDAAHNMKQQYAIDENRIYIAGMSGGGRVASMMGIGFADVFTGGCYICGCNFYRNMVSQEQGGKIWSRTFGRPPASIFSLAKKRSHVLVTGENDMNREQTQVNSEGYRKDGFQHVTYFEIKGMGHNLPSAEWFEKAVVALEEAPVVSAPATRPAAVAGEASDPDQPQSAPQRLLGVSRLYIQNGMYPQARERLEKILKDSPESAEAKEARRLLDEIKGK